MKLKHEFIQLPYQFDVDVLQQEVNSLAKELWTPHHEGFNGNFSIPLVSRGGEMNNDFKGPMACTPLLDECLYLRQVIASFGQVVGRSRLMGLDPGAQVPVHSDINYHWYKRVRIHVPIVTDPNVAFYCGDKQLHMQAGDAWIFDSWKYHQVKNNSDLFRVHLVIDICGDANFWRMTQSGAVPWIDSRKTLHHAQQYPFKPGHFSHIETEKYNTPLVMAPGEMEGLARDLIDDIKQVQSNAADDVKEMVDKVNEFCHQWRCLWSLHGFNQSGWPHYHQLRQKAFEEVRHLDSKLTLLNGTQAPRMYLHCMIDPGLNVEVKDSFLSDSTEQKAETPASLTSQVALAEKKPTIQLSRNDPCHCGSGKKYKHCHGKLS